MLENVLIVVVVVVAFTYWLYWWYISSGILQKEKVLLNYIHELDQCS